MPKSKKKTKEAEEVKDINIVDEMRSSYIDYAMSVIVARALPDVRDGMKPVHRRILYAMYEDRLFPNASLRKSATVVGACLSKYHPHGDVAVYDSLVRMAQDFSLRYPLVIGQGNMGCFTKDTKVRLTDGRKISFSKLIKEQKKRKKHWTFSFNHKTRRVEIAEIKKPRLTKKNQKIIEITLDNGENIKCTPNHRFMLKNGRYKEATNLKPQDSLMPLYDKIYNGKENKNLKGYEMVFQPKENKWDFTHHLADKWNLNNEAYNKSEGRVRHHLDFNKLNNNPDNILRIQWEDHWNYHKKIAKKLWKNPETRKMHKEKAIQQWKNPEFKEKTIKVARKGYEEFLRKNPNFMQDLSKKAKKSLHKKWKDPSYKEKVIKSKILGYVHSLLNKYSKVTPNIYEKERINNGVPKVENALNYFDSFSEIITKSRSYNHKIVKIRTLQKKEDVYDLTIDGNHNFALASGIFVHNSIDGDSPAAMRYTESKMSKIGQEMLRDIEKETVNFVENYDGTRKEPRVLPSPVPQLLLNGALGIAVGMTTKIPPHNLSEICDATIHLIDNPEAETSDLFQWIQGPDFPTGGKIYNQKEIISAYSQGKGKITMRGKTDIEKLKNGKVRIIITEIPYQVQKSGLVEKMADLVTKDKVKGVRDIRDLSDREGMRIAIDVKKGFNPKRILNRFYKFTDLQKNFYLNMLALVGGIQPKIMSLADVLRYFIEHRKEVIKRRTQFDLDKAKARAHILEGLSIALGNIDEIIETIKKSDNKEKASKNLMKKFKLSEKQAEAILQIKLQSLVKLEQEKINQELKELKKRIKELASILKSHKRMKEIIKEDLEEFKEKYGDQRKTKVIKGGIKKINEADLVPLQKVVVTLTKGGYIKRMKPSTYKIQKRGGKGIIGMKTMEGDVVEHFLFTSTHDDLLFFTDSGKVFQTKVYEIPEAKRVARGRGLLNFLEISSEEKVLSIVPIEKEENEGVKYLLTATKNGKIKKTGLDKFKNIRKSGIIGIRLAKNDLVRKVIKTTGDDEIVLITKKGKIIRFHEKEAREMGRGAAGVKGIRLSKDDEVVSADLIRSKKKDQLLVITENGYGKRTDVSKYKSQKRGGTGIKTANITSKTGDIVISTILRGKEKDLIMVSQRGQVIRVKIDSVSLLGRATQGVRIMRLNKKDKIASGACI